MADDFTGTGRPLNAVDLELLARTAFDGETIGQVATELGLAVQAAYKRRQRAEVRIASLYRITARRRVSGRAQPPAATASAPPKSLRANIPSQRNGTAATAEAAASVSRGATAGEASQESRSHR